MQILKGFWQFLNTDVKEIPWGELAEKGIEVVTTSNEMSKTLKEQAPQIDQLKPYFQQVEPFLTRLDSPVTQLALSGLPFVSIGIGLLRIYLDLSKTEPTYESSVAIAAQIAYLQSLEIVLQNELQLTSDVAVLANLEQVSLRKLVEKQLARLEGVQLSTAEAKTVTNRFRESLLAERFGEALAEQLQQVGWDEATRQRLVDQVAWGTPRYLHQAIAAAGDKVQPLAELYRMGGQEIQERYDSIETYLQEKIARLPEAKVFDETITFRDLYVPLQVRLLTQEGQPIPDIAPVNIHNWAREMLEQQPDSDQPRKVMFVEGDAGRGKSVFCRMIADWVRQQMQFSYVPILIRLRNLQVLANNLTQTLSDCPDLEMVQFVRSHPDWLADRNQRFLIILDGFDELLLEGRASGGLQEFLEQVAKFNSHHQFVVTGRPLALQGIDRLITQTRNLARVRLEPMTDPLRKQWLQNWEHLFGEPEATAFRDFLETCPEEIGDQLAREPLLLYLLGRLHREGHLNREMFAGAADSPNRSVQAKIRIYRESVNWVLEKQREDENLRLAGLDDLDDLREVLREAALCVVQSGNETARLTMLKARFQDSANPVANFLKQAQQSTGQSEDKALNNLLTTFYLKPSEGDQRGSVEFAHKSFGEYLFAERLLEAFKAWTELDRKGKRYILDESSLNAQIYDLLGYGGLSKEIVEYLFELLNDSKIEQVKLFKRLHEFYRRWCTHEFIDQGPTENLPQKKMLQLRTLEIPIGLQQVDVYAGLNMLILLFKLHAAAQPEEYPHLATDSPKPAISFHPCGEPGTEEFESNRLLKLIYYADSIHLGTFSKIVGLHLFNTNLSNANLDSADLINANLDSTDLFNANLSNANLDSADLSNANLSNANLFGTNLFSANLFSANLTSTNFSNANLDSANFDSADLSNSYLTSTNPSNASLFNVYLFNAHLFRTNLDSANLSEAHLISAILLGCNLSNSQLSRDQLTTSESPPLLCATKLPPGLEDLADRDCDRLPQVLAERYPATFETLEAATEFVNQFRQSS